MSDLTIVQARGALEQTRIAIQAVLSAAAAHQLVTHEAHPPALLQEAVDLLIRQELNEQSVVRRMEILSV